jgi:hypothetical protein
VADGREGYADQPDGKRKLIKNLSAKPAEAASLLTVKYRKDNLIKE